MKTTIYLHNIYLCIILGIAHGLADGAAGFLLGSLSHTMSLEKASGLIIIYNVLGFGYQPLAGIFSDKWKCPHLATLLGLFSLLFGLLLTNWHSQMAVILAGIGSAAFHVGAGSLAITTASHRTTGLGIFTAPGVVGLAIGGAAGWTGYNLTLPISLLLVFIIVIIAINRQIWQNYELISCSTNESENAYLDDGIVLILLMLIALISTVWTSFQFLLQNNLQMLIIIAIAAAIAKVCGGILAEYWGWKWWMIISLTIAAFLLLVNQKNHLSLILSLALLQSTVPITLAATARIMPQQPATATGFALGFSIIIGGVPVILDLSNIVAIPTISFLIVTITTLSFYWILKSKVIQKDNL